MWTLRWLGCGMPFDAARPKNSIGKLSVPSKEATRHMMNKVFQNGISQFEKKIRPGSPISFHSFGNLKKVYRKFFFHVDMIALAAYAEQLLPRGKAAVYCILPRGIVWTHLKNFRSISRNSLNIFEIFLEIFKYDSYFCFKQPLSSNIWSQIRVCLWFTKPTFLSTLWEWLRRDIFLKVFYLRPAQTSTYVTKRLFFEKLYMVCLHSMLLHLTPCISYH